MRKLNRRQFLQLAALASAGSFLAACGGDKPAEDAPEDSAPEVEKVTLQQWYHEYGEAGCQEAVYRIAEEYTNSQDKIAVEVTWNPGDYSAKLSSALASGVGPDIYEDSLNIDKVRNNYVVALDDLFTPEVKDDFDEKDLAYNSLNGKVYGVRMIIDLGLVWFRNSLLEEAGVEVPTSFDELIAAAETLTTGRQKGLFIGNDGGGILQDQMAYAAGVKFMDENNEVAFNTPVLAETWLKAKEVYNQDYLLTGSPTGWWDPGAFTQGLCAMCWGGMWMMPEVERLIGDDFTVTHFPAVEVPGGSPTPSTFWGGWVEFVNGTGENIELSKEYVNWQWIENTEWQNEWASAYGFHVPSRKSAAAANPKFADGNGKIAKDGLYKYGQANGPLWNGAMGTAVGDAYWHIVRDGMDAEQEIQNAYDTCVAELDRELEG